MSDNARPLLLVTGAGGFLGAAVARAALAEGYQVAAIVRRRAAPRLAGLSGAMSVHVADLSDAAATAGLVAELRPAIVIHCAWGGVGGALRAGDIQFENIRNTAALADAAIAAGARKFVGIGSQAEYGRYDRAIREDDLPNPSLLYGAAKLSACHLARQRTEAAGIDFAWLRLFAIYGPGDNTNWLIPSAIAELRQGRAPRTTAGTQRVDYLHVDDAARGVLACAVTSQATGVFNLASNETVTVRALIESLRDLVAPGLALRFGDVPFGSNQIMHLEGDTFRLRAATGWAPRIALADGLAETARAARLAA